MKDNNNNNQVYELVIPSSNSPPSDSDISATKEQDRFLPIANVSRIMKRSLPANAKISKEAKETVQECVSEFISFVTGEASDRCQREKRKTINGDDLLWAMTTLGFDNYVLPLKAYLSKYRASDILGEKSADVRQLEQPMALPLHEQGGHGGMMDPDLDMHPNPIEIHGLQWCP